MNEKDLKEEIVAKNELSKIKILKEYLNEDSIPNDVFVNTYLSELRKINSLVFAKCSTKLNYIASEHSDEVLKPIRQVTKKRKFYVQAQTLKNDLIYFKTLLFDPESGFSSPTLDDLTKLTEAMQQELQDTLRTIDTRNQVLY